MFAIMAYVNLTIYNKIGVILYAMHTRNFKKINYDINH